MCLAFCRARLVPVRRCDGGSRMKTIKSVAGLLTLVASVWSLQVMATPRIDLNPTLTNATVGSTFLVDVVITGLSGPAFAVSDFDLDISYDPSLLQFSGGVNFGTGLGSPPDIFGSCPYVGTCSPPDPLPGTADLFAISFADYSTLRGLQGDHFTLATLSFLALAPGTSSLEFVQNANFIFDVIGAQDQIFPNNLADPEFCDSQIPCLDVGGGRVVIRQGTVPEPNPLLLLAAAALALIFARRGGRFSR